MVAKRLHRRGHSLPQEPPPVVVFRALLRRPVLREPATAGRRNCGRCPPPRHEDAGDPSRGAGAPPSPRLGKGRRRPHREHTNVTREAQTEGGVSSPMLSLLFPTLHTMYTVPRAAAALDQVLRTPVPSALRPIDLTVRTLFPGRGPGFRPFQGRTTVTVLTVYFAPKGPVVFGSRSIGSVCFVSAPFFIS